MASEFALLARVLPLLDPGPLPGLLIPNGDDAVAFAPGALPWVLSTDASVEGVHFRRSFFPLDVIASRAFAAAISDLAAMGAKPRGALVALQIPASYDDGEREVLFAGLARAARRFQCPIVGGNLSAADALAITTTVFGDAERPLPRSGAKPGDVLQIAGTVGAASLGLATFLDGREELRLDPELEPVRRAFRSPDPPLAAGLLAGPLATAAIDISDGLAADLTHLARASAVPLDVDAAAIDALAYPLRAVAARLGRSAEEAVLHGGEDYALVVTAPTLLEGFFPLGVVAGDDRPPGVYMQGARIEPRGFDHFSR